MTTIKIFQRERENRLRNFIQLALQRYNETELIDMFNRVSEIKVCPEMDNDEMAAKLAIDGYCIFKPETFDQQNRLKEYAENFVFPHYNQQQTTILF